uniref:Histamine receptor H3 n=1 Tax=Paramormyrops kingsleyae TaxID=1676925 RepID=A0A3B3RNZ8_9TELE
WAPTPPEGSSATPDGSLAHKAPVANFHWFSSSTSVFLAVLMTLLVLATVLGNALVILAFVVEKSLRTQGNFFFLNLAIADFLVGGFCIPVYIPYVLTGEWRLGRGLCKLWLVVDYTLCTASVFNIVLISFDRFISVTRAVNYRCQKGVTRQAVLKMVSVWLAAFLLYGPAIVSWEYIAGGSGVPAKECYAEFYFNWYFLMTASTVEFFTPFISVTYFNLSIYINIRKRNLMRAERPASVGARDCEMELRGRSGAEERQVFFVRPAPAPGRQERGVLYPLCHTNFRRAFNKLLCPAKIKIQPQYMEQKC